MKDNNKIHQKVKDSFDRINQPAPHQAWDHISHGIDGTPAENLIDEKVRESFGKLENAAPAHVWEKISTKLNIDSVWVRVADSLRGYEKIDLWRTVGRVSVIAVLILITGYLYLGDRFRPDEIESEGEEMSEALEFQHPEDPIDGNSDQIEANVAATDIDNSDDISNYRADSFPYEIEIIHVASAHEIPEKSGDLPHLPDDSRPPYNPDPVSVNKIHYQIPAYILQPDTAASSIYNLRAVDFELITGNSEFPKSRVRNSFRVGITFSYNNTWLIDNDTRNSFDPNSLISSHSAYASSYGTFLEYSLTHRSSLLTQFYVASNIHMHYNDYDEGRYYSKDVELSYYKFSLLYKRRIDLGGRRARFAYTYNFGGYYAHLKDHIVHLNTFVSSGDERYFLSDYGFKFSTGQEIDLGRVVFELGLNAEWGMKNIYRGDTYQPGAFNFSRNANIGFYLSLGYKL